MENNSRWDLFIRICHWTIAIAIVLNLFVLEDDPHQWVGYAAVGVFFLRFFWGLSQKASPRWSNWKTHNWMASTTYILIWSCIIALGVTGFMMGTDKYWGEEWLEEIHLNISRGIQVLVVLHLLGVFSDSYRFKRRTWMSMINGERTIDTKP